jgi:hypothetical protein
MQVHAVEHPSLSRKAFIPPSGFIVDRRARDVLTDGGIPRQPAAGFAVEVAGAVVEEAGLGVALFSGRVAATPPVEESLVTEAFGSAGFPRGL